MRQSLATTDRGESRLGCLGARPAAAESVARGPRWLMRAAYLPICECAADCMSSFASALSRNPSFTSFWVSLLQADTNWPWSCTSCQLRRRVGNGRAEQGTES